MDGGREVGRSQREREERGEGVVLWRERESDGFFYILSSSFQLCPPSAFHPPLMMEGGKKEWEPLPHQTNAVRSNWLRTVSNSPRCRYRASEVVSWWGLALGRCPSSAQRCLMGLICRVLFRLINFFPTDHLWSWLWAQGHCHVETGKGPQIWKHWLIVIIYIHIFWPYRLYNLCLYWIRGLNALGSSWDFNLILFSREAKLS